MAGNPGLLTQRIAAWNQTHPNRPIDPKAEFAVAKQEGLGGGIGDGGHAFGPNQLNNAGGVLTGKFAGESPQQINQWAWSPAGIDYALAGVANVAGGLHGQQAVNAIVRQFERPANPDREAANALAAYGGSVSPFNPSASPQPVVPRQPVAPVMPGAQASPIAAALRLLGFNAPPQQRQPSAPVLPAAPRTPIEATSTTAAPFSTTGGKLVGDTSGEQSGFLQRLAALSAYEHAPIDINSGYRSQAEQAALYANRANNPNPVAPPGRSLHQQGLAADGTVNGIPLGTLPAAILAKFGLETVPGDPVHVQFKR